MKNLGKTFFLLGSIISIALASLWFFGFKSPPVDHTANHNLANQINLSCIEVEKHRVKGNSLEPLVPSGAEVYVLRNYYSCNPLKRGDIVVFKFKTRKELFVKKLVGMPGDVIEFEGNHLRLNNKILKNSRGEPYIFSERSKRILSIPLKNGKIPENMYLVLGEETKNSFDSREFGYLSKEHILGKVVLIMSREDARDYAKKLKEFKKVILFWNKETKRFEVYVIDENKFYTITGELIE